MESTKGQITAFSILVEVDDKPGILVTQIPQIKYILNYLTESSEDGHLTIVGLPSDFEMVTLESFESDQVH